MGDLKNPKTPLFLNPFKTSPYKVLNGFFSRFCHYRRNIPLLKKTQTQKPCYIKTLRILLFVIEKQKT